MLKWGENQQRQSHICKCAEKQTWKLFGFQNEYFQIFCFTYFIVMMLLWRAQQIFNAIVTKMDIYVGLQDLRDPWQERS